MADPSGLTAYYLFLYYYYFGSNLNICDPKRTPFDCTRITTPSCVYYTGSNCNSETGYCQQEVTNYCEACRYPNMIDYRIGKCSDSELYSCLQEDRTRTCDDTDEPVCGYSLTQANGDVTYQNYVNGCNACKVSSVGFYTKRSCWLEFSSFKVNGRTTKSPSNVNDLSLPVLSDKSNYQTPTSYVIWSSEDIGDSTRSMTITIEQNGATDIKVNFAESVERSMTVTTSPKKPS